LVFTVAFGIVWAILDNAGTGKDWILHGADGKVWFTFQIMATQGYDDAVREGMKSAGFAVLEKLLLTAQLVFGLVVFAVLVGIITDSVTNLMTNIADGQTRVVEKNHTLLLGWNEATLRCVCQISFLRRTYQVQNKGLLKQWIPHLRIPASSPAAENPIVIMASVEGLSKTIMQERIEHALAERGLPQEGSRVGWAIICRVGDPTKVQDLIRVSAGAATRIISMMTDEDRIEDEESLGAIKNGATIRTLLALRTILAASPAQLHAFDSNEKHLVVQLQTHSSFVDAACFPSPSGKKVVETVDVSRFVNALLFLCASKRNLSQVVMSVLSLDSAAFRCRPASQCEAGPDSAAGFLIGKTFREACACCSWRVSILVGVTNRSVLYRRDGRLEGDAGEIIGIIPQPDYVIRPEDILIFISTISFPVVSSDPRDRPSYHRRVLEELASVSTVSAPIREAFYPRSGDAARSGLAASAKPVNLLPIKRQVLDAKLRTRQRAAIFGWRSVWDEDPKRLKNRIMDVAKAAAKGSYLCFLNQMPTEGAGGNNFAAKMVGIATPLPAGEKVLKGWTQGWSITGFPNIKIYHRTGNAAIGPHIQPILAVPGAIEVAVVLETQGNSVLKPKSMDTRMLSTLLLMRHLTRDWPKKLHIISENQLDQTADVAVTPGGAFNEPDFVNTQAVAARSLVMAMAYPLLQPCLNELFADEDASDGSPEFDIITCAFLGLGHRVVPFGVVQQVVSAKFDGYAVAIGFMTDSGQLSLAPGIGYCQEWKDADKIVILRRRFYDMAEARRQSVTKPTANSSFSESPLSGIKGGGRARGTDSEESSEDGEDSTEDSEDEDYYATALVAKSSKCKSPKSPKSAGRASRLKAKLDEQQRAPGLGSGSGKKPAKKPAKRGAKALFGGVEE